MFRVHFPLDEITRDLRRIQGQLEQDKQDLLNILGVELLSLSQQAYREKARGGIGSDGISWAPLNRKTLEARVRRRAPARRIVQERRKLAEQIRAAKGKNADKKIRDLRKKRKALADRLQAMVDREFSRYEIGVDTGLQRASASPGFTGGDGKGGNFLEVTGQSVTVGYNRSYSEHFDKKRPLFPEQLPAPWAEIMGQRTQLWADTTARKALEGNG